MRYFRVQNADKSRNSPSVPSQYLGSVVMKQNQHKLEMRGKAQRDSPVQETGWRARVQSDLSNGT